MISFLTDYVDGLFCLHLDIAIGHGVSQNRTSSMFAIDNSMGLVVILSSDQVY